MSVAEQTVRERLPRPITEVEASLGLPGGSLSVVGLDLGNAELTLDNWLEIGHTLAVFVGMSRWALGDWLLWGEGVFGEESSQAVDSTTKERYDTASRITGLKIPTLMSYTGLCLRVPIHLRRVELDFTVHEAVRALATDEEKAHWLNEAVVNSWTREELRDAIREATKAPGEEEGGQQVVDEPTRDPRQRVLEAARSCYDASQPTSEGGALIPPEPWHLLIEALGEE